MTSLGSEHTEAENAAREQARQARDAALTVFVYVFGDDARPDSFAEKPREPLKASSHSAGGSSK